MYYTQEEDLTRDAKKTELEFTSARILVEKLKAAFIGGKIQIARIVFIVLSIAVLVLPSYNLILSFPWWEYELSVGAIGIYGMISDSFWQMFDSVASIGVCKELFAVMIASFAALLAATLATASALVFHLLSFINIKKTAKGCAVSSVIGIIAQLAGTVLMFLAMKLSGSYEFISAKPLFGSLAGIAALGVFLALNIMLAVNPPEIRIKKADKKRLEIKARLKAGEITLDDLPLPIVPEDPSQNENEKPKKKKKGKNK